MAQKELLHRQSTIMLASMLQDVITKLIDKGIMDEGERNEMVRKADQISRITE